MISGRSIDEEVLCELLSRLPNGTAIHQKLTDDLERIRDFDDNWDEELQFFVEEVEPWMEKIPAVWVKPQPFPHPVHEGKKDADYKKFLAEQRRLGGQEAAYLTNSIRWYNQLIREIFVSRMWLITALEYEGKVGSDGFWDEVLDEVARGLPNWTLDHDGDRLPPDVKTIRNMINVRLHKRFLTKIIGIKISHDK